MKLNKFDWIIARIYVGNEDMRNGLIEQLTEPNAMLGGKYAPVRDSTKAVLTEFAYFISEGDYMMEAILGS